MATSSPPSNVITFRADPPSAPSSDGSLSPQMTDALEFLDELNQMGVTLAPTMPDPLVLARAARKSGISAIQALTAYRIIIDAE